MQKDNIRELVVKNLILEDASYDIPKSGCYVKNIHILQIFNKPIALPLNHIDYNIKIIDNVTLITLEQQYTNPLDTFLELQYSFPIRENICIHSFKSTFDDYEIIGKVKAKELAKKQYEEGLKEGRQMVYGEIDEKTKEFMNMKIGNVSPHSIVKINIQFIQELEVDLNMFWKLNVPSLISPRYQNESIKLNKSHVPDTTWSFKVELKTTRKCLYSDSKSHKIKLISQNDNQLLFVMEKSEKPNRDFVFMFTTVEFDHPHCIRGQTDTSQTLILSFIPKFNQLNVNDAWKMAVEKKDYQVEMESIRSEYIFLLDRSGSMDGSRITKAKEALVFFIRSLPQNSYFNIYSFGSEFIKLFDVSAKYSDKTVKQAVSKIEQFNADMGGTEIYQPLQSAFKSDMIKGYPKQVFLLTDGDVQNTIGVLTLIKKNNKYCRVHSIGIGSGASQELIIKSASNGKGNHIFIGDNQNVSAKIIELLGKSLSPVLTDFKLHFDQSVVESIIPNPDSMPYILKNDPINIFVILKQGVKQSIKFILEYIDSIKDQKYSHELNSDPNQVAYDFVDKMAHHKQLNILCESINHNKQVKEDILISKVEDLKNYVICQSVRHQVLCEYTSYICEGKDLKDQKYQQYKKVGVNKHPRNWEVVVQCHSRQKLDNAYILSQDIWQQPHLPIKKQAIKLENQPKRNSGFFSSITDFFSKLFFKHQIKSQQCVKECCEQRNQQYRLQKFCLQDQQYRPQQYQNNESNDKNLNIKKLNQVKDLIQYQKSDGSWDESSFDQICKSLHITPSIFSQLIKNVSLSFILTFIVVEYLKRQNSAEYTLIIKKADNWIKKTVKQQNISNDIITELIQLIKL